MWKAVAGCRVSGRRDSTNDLRTLGKLRFYAAIVARKLDLSLPYTQLTGLLFVIIVSNVPAPLWAASLTPHLTTIHNTATITSPVLGNDNFSSIFPTDYSWNIYQKFTSPSLGTFSDYVARYFLSSLLIIGAHASNASQTVSRFDNTQMLYVGRSYGVGASVGLLDQHLSEYGHKGQDYLEGYTYNETGFSTVVNCSYNRENPWQLVEVQEEDEGMPALYWAKGTDAAIVAWTSCINPQTVNVKNQTATIYIAAGDQYAPLKNVTCTVRYEPKLFNIEVSRVGKNISVTPLSDFTGTLDPEWHIRNLALEQLQLISQSSTTLYFSSIGDSLLANMAVSTAVRNSSSTASNLAAVADSFTYMLDSILLALTSAQTQMPTFSMNTSLSQELHVQRTLTAVQFGSRSFIIALSCINALTVLALICFASRTKFWKDLPSFNTLDLGSVIVASTPGGQKRGWNGDWDHSQSKTGLGRMRFKVSYRSVGESDFAWVLALGSEDQREVHDAES
ncbi:hypothetical protein B7463_g11774, partial [Scytalidium lignicola]